MYYSWRYQYDADPRKFTSKERDAESGLDEFGARYYSSGFRRFLTVDAVAISRSLEDPQSLNKYSYAFNNPLKFIDPDGSTRVMTNLDKAVYDSLDYLPFGEQIAGDTGSSHKFTGKERDSESNLDNFGARYMGSSMGRFMSPDSIANDWELLNPQTWNRYAYARNNPLVYIDPDGAAVELFQETDEERKKALEQLKKDVGNKEAADCLYINEVKDGDKTRYFVGIKGDVGDFMKLSDTAHDLANLVQDKQVVEFGLTKQDLSDKGGAATYEKGEIGNQNVRVLVNPDQAVSIASRMLGYTILGQGRFAGQNEKPRWQIQSMTRGIAVWHEFGHGWGYIHGRVGSKSNSEAVQWENRMRKQVYGPLGPRNAPRARD